MDSAGNLLIADFDSNRVRLVPDRSGTSYGQAMKAGNIYTIAGGSDVDAGDGGPATSAWLNSPAGVAVGPAGDVLIADLGNARVREVAG